MAVTDPDTAPQQPLSWNEAKKPFLVSVAAAVALVLAVLGGAWLGSPRHPGDDSVDAGFARDMSAHHAQAVSMSMTIRTRSSATDIRTLAYDIATTQENQRGQMMAWLQTWGLPQALHGQPMDWMKKTGHQHAGLPKGEMLLPDGRMPGMASPAELRQLSSATGKPAEVLFLRLMIVHHKSGIEMAQVAQTFASDPLVVRLAGTMVKGQQSEINLMNSMLKSRGEAPVT